jgi:hypothetical protein
MQGTYFGVGREAPWDNLFHTAAKLPFCLLRVQPSSFALCQHDSQHHRLTLDQQSVFLARLE